MTQCVPYRVVVTGIPVNVSPEAFYDALRASTAECGVYNALLVQIPTSTPMHKAVASTQHIVQMQKSQRSTGAAFIDFDSKAHAEAVMRAGLWVDGAEVQWRLLGPVRCTRGSLAVARESHAELAHKRGREAFEVLRWHTRAMDHEPVPRTEQTTSQHTNQRTGCTGGKSYTESATADAASAEETEVETLLTTSDVRLDDMVLGCTSSGSSVQERDMLDVALYNALDREIMRYTLGHLRSLSRLSAREVHITTDEHTAALLYKLGHFQTKIALSTHFRSKGEYLTGVEESGGANDSVKEHARVTTVRNVWWTVQPTSHCRLDKEWLVQNSEALSNNTSCNFVLATKSEVLEAMAAMMSATGGKYAALQDSYGNLYFAK